MEGVEEVNGPSWARPLPTRAAKPTPSKSTSGQHVSPSNPVGATKLVWLMFFGLVFEEL